MTPERLGLLWGITVFSWGRGTFAGGILWVAWGGSVIAFRAFDWAVGTGPG
jgi:hypothetical protein